MALDVYAFTDVGGRDENQDSVGFDKNDSGGVFIVADGLGGHQSGRLSADCAVETLVERWRKNPRPDRDALTGWIGDANKRILALQAEKNVVTKSTVVSLVISGSRALWAHAGDSRLYYIHNDEIASITDDHSVAYKKYKAGEITRAQIATDEDQSCLLRNLGNETRWEPGVNGTDTLEKGDAFFMCSDGLWEYLLDEEVLIDRLKTDSAREWGSLLLLRAAERIRPGNDNLSMITVIVR